MAAVFLACDVHVHRRRPGQTVNYFVAKTEPSVYSIDQLQSDQRTLWDGVRNPQAVRAILSMRPDDRVFIYHSGGISAIVGLAAVVGEPRQDENDPKSAVVELRYLTHIQPPTTLSDIKISGRFNNWSLIRQARLSTMTAPEDFVEWMRDRYPALRI